MRGIMTSEIAQHLSYNLPVNYELLVLGQFWSIIENFPDLKHIINDKRSNIGLFQVKPGT